ncbi:isoleucine--tRNA ligase [Striga asiatica]|uniref:isoleucine--tRNA ligase n=1 Tax=Striga asiatica TaxID=4170 RepID=A0A5A7R7E5_STRAF|nr:isoleucine--tRNA ligase [Striga asiatica]
MNSTQFTNTSTPASITSLTKMAVQNSSHRALTLKSCSSLRNTTAVSLLRLRKSSSARVLSLLQATCYSTCSGIEYCSSSKRRSRGPVMAGKGKSEGEKQEDGKYKNTIDLPKTAFGLRANSVVREPEIQRLWDENQVFKRVARKNTGGSFVIHDGPPYANGDLHMGHAMNKILKDIINRYKSLDQDARKELTPLKLRAKAAKFAKSTVKNQMAAFKRYGIWGDWDHPYLTLDPEYEAAQIEVFGKMALQGYIYRGRKPVHWSPSSRTALAEAELEYPEGHVSKSMYAVFKLISAPTSSKMLDEFIPNLGLAVWTTTPWTIPANAAVAVNAKLQYAVVEIDASDVGTTSSSASKEKRIGNILKEHKKLYLVVALDLVPTVEEKWGVKLTVKTTLTGAQLENCRYVHPIESRECPVVIGGDYITTESGTGLVHTAPGHGHEDYITGLKYDLPVLSPVDDEGVFTEEAGQFSGLNVLGDGNIAVIECLDKNSSMIMVEPYKHKYPYDWRTKKPTIFRATEQWFASVEGFRNAAMDSIDHVNWIPPQARNRISSMTSSRSDWCISRQRTWGVPIPVFYHVETKEPLMNEETIDHIKSIISQKGSDAWWYMKVEDLLPERYRKEASSYVKGTDTMDVWFDSGSSWAAVLAKRNDLSYPADLYLEGTDQHRGWFQSSLLTSIATNGKAPYCGVITHGFVLDEKGFKMSKSLGNVVDPRTVIEGGKDQKDGFGADADYAVTYTDLPKIDQYALFQLESVVKNIKESYDDYQFFRIFQIIQRFVVVDLSNFYLDVAKDRLYVGGTTSSTRRSCQTVLAAHLISIARIIAPILPHLAEDVWQNLPFTFTAEDGCLANFVFESRWPLLNERHLAFPEEEVNFWATILEASHLSSDLNYFVQLRTEVNKVLEIARTKKLIGSSLEAKVYLHASDAGLLSRLVNMCEAENDADTLYRIFLTSQVEILASLENVSGDEIACTGEYVIENRDKVWIGVSRADGSKCERCWNFSPEVGNYQKHPTLCGRCHGVVVSQPIPALAAAS